MKIYENECVDYEKIFIYNMISRDVLKKGDCKMQKAVRMIALGMLMGMAFEKCFVKKCTTQNNSQCMCNELEKTTNKSNENECCSKKGKLDSLIEEFNSIDLSEVKEKTKQALEKIKCKLKCM